MDRNLYAPPKAEIVDLEAPEITRPKAVTWAIGLLWTWSAIYAATLLITQWGYWFRMSSNQPAYALWSGIVLRIVITAAIAYRLARGGNWTRILMTVFFVISLLYLPTEWRNHLEWIDRARTGATSWGFAVLMSCRIAVSRAVHLAWVILLFTPQASSWFDTMSYYAGTGMDPTKFGKSPTT